MKKVLIKESGEIFDVTDEYSMKTFEMSISLPYDLESELKEKIESQTWTNDKVKMKTDKPKEDYYVLSNGEVYESDELVIGLEEIRDWKIKNNLKI